ncbi:MAG: T9SS type A sorting domain-containing protein [Bacteroidota bacterium]
MLKYMIYRFLVVVLCLTGTSSVHGQDEWRWGSYGDSTFIPITIYLQSVEDVDLIREAGFNTYSGFWYGLTDQILSVLRAKEMHYIAGWEKHEAWPGKEKEPDLVAQANIDDPLFLAWLQEDEPDNAQPDGEGGYGPCMDPQVIIDMYNEIKTFDTTGRQVILNCGAGVARSDAWIRGDCAGNTDSYTEYYKGADIASYDIYPVASPPTPIETNDELWYITKGVKNMREYTSDTKDAYWFNLECTEIGGLGLKPTPDQMWIEAWMGIVAGGTAISWFPFTVYPMEHNSRALLEDPEMMTAVERVNRAVHDLAMVINSETKRDLVDLEVLTAAPWDPPYVEIDYLVKHVADTIYILTSGGAGKVANTATFTLNLKDGFDAPLNAIAIYEEREIPLNNHQFSQEYQGQETHLFKIGGVSEEDLATGVEDQYHVADEKIILKQNFPNPFHNETFVTYTLEKPAEIELAVYNQLGQEVAMPDRGLKPAGSHTIKFDATGLAAGVYYYRLKTGGSVQARKMSLIN